MSGFDDKKLMKKCAKCKEFKEFDAFSDYSRSKDGKRSYCKSCAVQTSKEWNQRNPGSQRQRNVKHRYGICPEAYDLMLRKQHHTCAICGVTHNNGKDWCVDHCHTNKNVRGLLCSQCNLLLGYAKDSKEILSKAIIYLEANEYG